MKIRITGKKERKEKTDMKTLIRKWLSRTPDPPVLIKIRGSKFCYKFIGVRRQSRVPHFVASWLEGELKHSKVFWKRNVRSFDLVVEKGSEEELADFLRRHGKKALGPGG